VSTRGRHRSVVAGEGLGQTPGDPVNRLSYLDFCQRLGPACRADTAWALTRAGLTFTLMRLENALFLEILRTVRAELLAPLDPSYLGPMKHIYCYLPEEGGCPAREFLDGLPREARASYAVLFRRRCQIGQLRGDTHRKWTEKGCEGLFEFKDNQSKTRLMHTTDAGQTDVLLFGFGGKKENKVDQVHVNRAMRLRDEYRRRRTEIERRVAGALRGRR
jgi:hypothetical protein